MTKILTIQQATRLKKIKAAVAKVKAELKLAVRRRIEEKELEKRLSWNVDNV